MFARLRAEYGDSEGFVAHILSHPTLSDRIAAAEAAAATATGAGAAPVLTAQEWADLQAMC